MDITYLFWLHIEEVLLELPDEILHQQPIYLEMSTIVSKEYPLMMHIDSFNLTDNSILFDFMEISSLHYNNPYYNNPYLVFNNYVDLIYFMKEFLTSIDDARGPVISRCIQIIEEWVDQDDLCTAMKSIRMPH